MDALVRYGWSNHFAQHVDERDGLNPARICAQHRTAYRVFTDCGEQWARVSGTLRHDALDASELPVVGDWVLTPPPAMDGDLQIMRVLPRRSKFSRKVAGNVTQEQVVAANVDTVWIVSALDRDYRPRRIERYLTLAWESGARPVIVLTKSDLVADVSSFQDAAERVAIGVPVHAVSIVGHRGLEALRDYFKGHATVAVIGSSGVGKSTLVNALVGGERQTTQDVRADGKGRHTTVHRQLVPLPTGGMFMDTPGMRELQLWDASSGLDETFRDIDQLADDCRFSDCHHAGEPGCAVQAAVDDGRLAEDRLASYAKLQRELSYLDSKQDVYAQRQAKQKHKAIMKSLRNHPKYRR